MYMVEVSLYPAAQMALLKYSIIRTKHIININISA
jgi:hypothetical protein